MPTRLEVACGDDVQIANGVHKRLLYLLSSVEVSNLDQICGCCGSQMRLIILLHGDGSTSTKS